MNIFAGGRMGVGTIIDWGSDWSEFARLVFRLHADWADFPTPRPWVEPWTCCLLKGCAQPVLGLEGFSLPEWRVRKQEQLRGLCCRLKKKKRRLKYTYFLLFHRRIRDSPWGWINLRPLFFSFFFLICFKRQILAYRRQWDPRHPKEMWPRRGTQPPLMLQLSKPTDR